VRFWEIEQKELRWLLLESCFGNKGHVIAQSRGTFGDIFTFDQGENSFPRYGIAKTPRINPADSPEQIKVKIAKFLHEINETYKCSNHELIARHADVKICFGAPFVYSRKRDKTLQDVLDNQPVSLTESVSIIIQLAHGLGYCSSKGLSSHQDLKPDNVLTDLIQDHFNVPDDYPLAYRVFVCDFGMANAFSVFGKPFGSRPYMAPEQYGHPITMAKSDVFALGVIIHELISGVHPIGEITRDIWPVPLPQKGNKWKRENVWKAWARSTKSIGLSIIPNSKLASTVGRCLHPDIAYRHSMTSLEFELLDWLNNEDRLAAANLKLLLSTYDNNAATAEVSGWPYYEHLPA